MLSLRTLFLMTLTVSSLHASCGVGTLACYQQGDTFLPKICDFFNFYTLNADASACEKKEIANCQVGTVPNQTKLCYACDHGYILDLPSGSCVEVPEADRIQNCLVYSSAPLACERCVDEHYLDGGACVAVGDVKVANCLVYASATQCHTCKDGSYLLDNKCLTFTGIQNCHLYRDLECDRCDPKFLSDPSLGNTYDFNPLSSHAFDFANYVKYAFDYPAWTDDFVTRPCSKGEIDNCLQYDSPTQCNMCESGFYLNSEFRCVHFQKPPLVGCRVYFDETTCMECQVGYYLNTSTNTCVSATNVEFCARYHRSRDECAECNANYSLTSVSDSLSCVLTPSKASKINYCESSSMGAIGEECDSCREGYAPSVDKTRCLILVDKCEYFFPATAMEDMHSCYQCFEGYVLNTKKTHCVPKDMVGCERAFKDGSRCFECSKMMYITKDGKCANMDYATNCVESEQFNNKCRKCSPLFWKDFENGECLASNARDQMYVDEFCVSNNQYKYTSYCTECQEGYISIANSTAVVPLASLTSLHCAELDLSSQKCVQCAENSDGDGNQCNAPNNARTNPCLQMMPNYFGPDMDNNCAKCRNEKTHYLDKDSNSCMVRPATPENQNCDKFYKGNNGCMVCASTFYPMISTRLSNACYTAPVDGSVTSVAGCEIYSSVDGKCVVCEKGSVLSADQSTCTANRVHVEYFFDVDMELTTPPVITPVANCAKYKQIDVNEIACDSCNDGFVKIVDISGSPFLKYSMDHQGTHSLSLPAAKCVSPSLAILSSSQTGKSDLNCSIGIEIENSPNFVCINCSVGYIGIVGTLDRKTDGTVLNKSWIGMESCTLNEGMNQNYRQLENGSKFYNGYVPLSTFITYTASDDPVYKELILNSVFTEYSTITFKKSAHGHPFLVPIDKMNKNENFFNSTNIDVSKFPGCQIFSFSTEEKMNNHEPDRCVACAPGCKALYDPNLPMITSCQKIKDCPDGGDVLNGCSKASKGYALVDMNGAGKYFFYDSLFTDYTKIKNCIVYDKEKCVLCTKGFSLMDGQCVSVKDHAGQYNCEVEGFGANDLSLKSAENTNLALINNMMVLNHLTDLSDSMGAACKSCPVGSFKMTQAKEVRCVAEANVDASSLVANCSMYGTSSPVKCVMCESTHIMNVSTGMCVDKSSYANCQELKGESVNECSKCEGNYSLNTSGQCVNSRCAKMLKGECTLCDDGYKNVVGQNYCVMNTDSNDPCLAYSPSMKTCGKCKSNKYVFSIKHYNFATNSFNSHFVCDDLSGNLSSTGWQHMDMSSVIFHMSNSLVPEYFHIHPILDDEEAKRSFNNIGTTPPNLPAVNHCLPKRSTGPCSRKAGIDGVYCSKCEPGYTLDTQMLTCMNSNSVANCKLYSEDLKCLECEDAFFLVDPDTCAARNSSLNCPRYRLDANECAPCVRVNLFSQLVDSDFCVTDPNCQVADANNNCSECKSGYEVDQSSKRCVPIMPNDCVSLDNSTGLCSRCANSHWLDENDGNKCKVRTNTNFCVGFVINKDECKICTSSHYPNNGTCVSVTQPVDNCVQYISDGVCGKCTNFLDAKGNCFGNINGCKLYSSQTVCSQCESTHWAQSTSSCVQYSPDLFCRTFNATADRCIDCNTGWSLQSNGKCTDNGSTDPCLEKALNGVDCLRCIDTYYLDLGTKKCVFRTAQNCKEKQPNKDECLSCLAGHFMDKNNNNNCKAYTPVPNCILFDPFEDKCLICNSSTYLEKNECKPVTIPVAFCQIYTSNGVCGECMNTYTLKDNFCDRGSVENCYRHSSDSVCAKCDTGFFLESASKCTKYSDDLNCQTFKDDKDECVDCASGYFVNKQKKCELRDLNLHCLTFVSDENKCLSCLPDYFFRSSDNTCQLRTNKTCLVFEKERDACVSCSGTRWLNTSFICLDVTVVAGCEVYETNEDKCKYCEKGKYLSDAGTCLTAGTNIPDCKSYSDSDTCAVCEDTFALLNNACVKGTIDNCLTYASTTECTKCEDGHFLANASTCSVYSNDLNCATFNPSADECITCTLPKVLNIENKCIDPPVDANCETFVSGSSGDCQICKDGFFLDANTKVCMLNTAENCEVKAKDKNECESCKEMFWMDANDSNKCKAVTVKEFCIEYKTDADECKHCETTKLISNGACVDNTSFIPDCLHYSATNVCSQCEEYKMLVNNDCVDGNIPKCVTYDKTSCEECEAGYYLSNPNTCSAHPAGLNCEEFSKTEPKCVTCPTDYSINSAGACVTEDPTPGCDNVTAGTSECTSCLDGFILNTGTKKCDQRTAEHCASEEENIDQCKTCLNGYWLDSGTKKCVKSTTVHGCSIYAADEDACELCESGRFPKNKLCFEVTIPVENCVYYIDNGVCQICINGFTLVGEVCVGGTISGCNSYVSSTQCGGCKSGKYLASPTSCVDYSADLNCDTFNKTKDECIDCPSGRSLDDDKKCIVSEADPNCEVFKDNKIDCDVCKDGFFVDANTKKCVQQNVDGCIEYEDNSNQCKKCDEGKFLDGNECKNVNQSIQDCKFYSADGVCSECKDGFFLINNQCSIGDIDNCATYKNADECSKCKDTHYLQSPDTCTEYSDDLNCKTLDPNSDGCLTCHSNYFKNASGKCELYNMALNCQTFHSSLNQCLTCSDEHYLSSNACLVRRATSCESHILTADECLRCLPGFYKSGAVCVESTLIANCAVYAANTNSCETCSAGYVQSESSCVELNDSQTVDNCKVHSSPGVCSECFERYFLENPSTCSPGLITKCVTFSSAHVCLTCEDTHYRASADSCMEYSDDLNCATFNLTADECLTCPTNKVLDSDNKCVDSSADANCETFLDNSDDCKECKVNYVLNVVTRDCEVRTAENCKTVDPKVDQCLECNPLHWMDANDLNKCKSVTTVSSCSEYHSDKDACQACATNYFLESEQKCSPVTDTVSNCAVYSSATECSKCESSYVLTSPTECTSGSIDNCQEYQNNTTCSKCEDTHFLQSPSLCTVYSSDLNCLTKDPNADACLTCDTGRYLAANNKCLVRQNSANCKTAAERTDECTECEDDKYLDQSTKQCMHFTTTGCGIRSKIADKCVTCDSSHFMNNTTRLCQAYTPVDNCDIYYEDEDKCKFCSEGKYLDADENICRPNPDGIENCAEYSDLNTCAKCASNYFLSSNECVRVTSIIPNCQFYASASECSKCTSNFFLASASSCAETAISNCDELLSITSCKTCAPGYILYRDGSDLKCRDSGIADCIVAVGGVTNTCLKCVDGKIPSLDRLACVTPGVAPLPVIANCAVYSKVNECMQCEENFVRSPDCSACVAHASTDRITTNCASEIRSKNIVCDTCQPGYHKSFSNACEPCGGNGCALCNSDVCQMCREGFYMNSSSQCVLNSGTQTESASVGLFWKSWAALIVALAMVFMS